MNVRRLRVERKLTQEQLAHEAGIDLTYVGGIERGRRNPTVSVLGRLAASLGVHPRCFFDEALPQASADPVSPGASS